jgi:acetyl-CoA C-acetyltransferase
MIYQNNAVVVAGFARTPIGNFQGCLSTFKAAELGAIAIKAAVHRARIPIKSIDEVLMGCVLMAGQGQAPARQAAIKAGLPESVVCTTVNKMCGSGMKAIMFGYDLIKSGSADIVVAGGMESMSNAPYLLTKARQGLKAGHADLLDHLFIDGLEDPVHKRLMGCYAEDCAEKFKFTRAQQDEFARQSLLRARAAVDGGVFDGEIVPIDCYADDKPAKRVKDELPFSVDIDKISQLKTVFKQGGTVTAANSSSLSDGAAAVVLMSAAMAEHYQVRCLAQIVAHHSYAHHPQWFTTAPLFAIEQILEKINMGVADIDLYEINEAFAVVVLAAIQTLELPREKVNIHGGACALGHPLGASGARILVTLLAAMQRHGLKRGLASMCIGGGEATAMVIET